MLKLYFVIYRIVSSICLSCQPNHLLDYYSQPTSFLRNVYITFIIIFHWLTKVLAQVFSISPGLAGIILYHPWVGWNVPYFCLLLYSYLKISTLAYLYKTLYTLPSLIDLRFLAVHCTAVGEEALSVSSPRCLSYGWSALSKAPTTVS